MTKSPDAFRTISEVAEWLGVQAHVLRFWESKFSQVKPVKRAGGRRYYRPSDMQLLGGIKKLLHEDGLTIKGVQKLLREHGVGHVAELSQPLEEGADLSTDASEPAPQATVLSFRGAGSPANGPDRRAYDTDDDEDEDEDEDEDLPVIDPIPGALDDVDDGDSAEPPEADDGGDDALPTVPEEQAPSQPDLPLAADTPPPAPGLPSFMHRGAAPAPAEPDAEAVAEPPPAAKPPEPVAAPPAPEPETAAPPTARVIEAADPPAEADIDVAPGLLSILAGLDRFPAEDAARIAPLARDLRAWLDRGSGAGGA